MSSNTGFVSFNGPNSPPSNTPGHIVWRVVMAVMSLLFLVFAAVQYNDPDPYIWIPLYGIGGIFGIIMTISPKVASHRVCTTLMSVYLGMVLVGALCLFFFSVHRLSSHRHPLVHEEGRELAGMLILLLWLFLSICYLHRWRGMTVKYLSGRLLVVLTVLSCVVALIPIALWGVCYVGDLSTKLSYCQAMVKDCSKPTAKMDVQNVEF